MNFSLHKITSILNAQFIGKNDHQEMEFLSIDSRSMQNGSKTLFFALVGHHHDAHDYIPELINKGVSNFVVSTIPKSVENKANFLLVNNTLEALQHFAAHYRSQFHFPIIGITGSNGKTIVKEWLNFLLSPEYNLIRSPKSYNSQVGVPLSVLAINKQHNLGVFEAGISTVGEMKHLGAILRPTIGVLTTIGSAHDEGFESRAEKIQEKLKLFDSAEVIIYQKNKLVESLIPAAAKTFSWSFNDPSADVLLETENSEEHTLLKIRFEGKVYPIKIPFQDTASIENAMPCLMVLLYLNYAPEIISARMEQLFPVEMRLKLKNGIHNTTLIDDSYSSDFQSLKIALDFLESQKHHQKKTLILSDIFQSGLANEELYEKVAQLVTANKINRIITVGKIISSYKGLFENCLPFESTEALSNALENIPFGNETILIKGARTFQFEHIVNYLEEKTHETVLEINLNAISHNLNFYKSKIKPTTKMMAMIKAFGYGSGGFEIAKLLAYHHVDYLGVAFADEGISLKTAGIDLPIMVLNPESTSFSAIIQYDLEPEIYSIKGLKAFLKTTTEKKLIDYPIHLKLDTGMHRLGFEEENVAELIAVLKGNQVVQVKSILSHMATSDNLENHDFANYQIALFESLSNRISQELNIEPIRHLLNTSGISNYPQAQYDMVRLGIGLYGVSNNPEETKYLENVGTLKSVISQIRTIQKGESVGYGRKFIATEATTIATIPIGYADGISRAWGNGLGYVTIKNKKAPILGSICMDMLMVDVTAIACKEGDTVIVFGKNPTVSYMASQLHTIPYEILTSISQRVKRVFYRE
jgi:alanine racemase